MHIVRHRPNPRTFRCRNMISISLDRASYAAGGAITATISVSQKKPVKARGLSATLSCAGRRQVKTDVVLDQYDFSRDEKLGIPYSSNMKTRTDELDSVVFSQEKQICGAREFSGEAVFTVQFALPANAAPTSREFGHDNAIYIWNMSVRLDIPMAMDEHAVADVFVEGL